MTNIYFIQRSVLYLADKYPIAREPCCYQDKEHWPIREAIRILIALEEILSLTGQEKEL